MNITTGKWLYASFVSVMALALLSGCVARQGASDGVSDTMAVAASDGEDLDLSKMSDEERFVHNYRKAATDRMQEQWADDPGFLVADTAKTAIGTAYVRGGTSLNGFDCSGFVQWAYKHVGVTLPRTAREQAQVGELITDPDDLRVGDIVAFRHPRRGYHTGIYTGDGKFVHSPRRRESVKIASLSDPYFRTTFLGARRVEIPDTVDIAAVEKKLAANLARQAEEAPVQVASLRTSDIGGKSKDKPGKARVTTSQKQKRTKSEAKATSRSSSKRNTTASASKVSSGKAEKAGKSGAQSGRSVQADKSKSSQRGTASVSRSKNSEKKTQASSASSKRTTAASKNKTKNTQKK